MKLTKTYLIDFNETPQNETIHIHQNDSNSIEFAVSLLEKGQNIALSNQTVNYDVSVNNVLLAQNASGSVREGKIIIPITGDMTLLNGVMLVDVRISENNEVLHTHTLKCFVDRAVVNGSTVIDLSGLTINRRFANIESSLAGKLDDVARVIGERHIAPGAVTGSKLAENAVDNTHIKNGAVTEGKLSADVRSKLNGITPGGDIDLSDYYTKDEVDGALLDKADADDVDAALRDISTLSSGKADKTSVYTKAEIDNIIGSGSIVSTINSQSQTGDDVNYPSVNAVRNYSKSVIDDLGDVIEDEINEVAGDIPTKTSQLTNDSGFLTAHQDISGKENTSNKVTSISASSTNTQYPSALAVKNYVDTALGVIENGSY